MNYRKALPASLRFYAVSLFLLLAVWGLSMCSLVRMKPHVDSFRFAVTGNTYPLSPYKWDDAVLVKMVQDINRENPLFLVHTGNMIHGGHNWMGIGEKDINGQFDRFLSVFRSLNCILYPMAGTMDRYDGSFEIFEQRTGRKVSYSFNYGRTHFIILETTGSVDGPVAPASLQWLKTDLREYGGGAGTIVFTNQALVRPGKGKGEFFPVSMELHGIFLKHPVAAVLSAEADRFFECRIDGIAYINAPCSGFRNEGRFQQGYQYYMAEFDGVELRLQGRNVVKNR